jgi:heme-degrading monooxygenase HmoA
MYIIIWEYQVKPERQAEFEKIYTPNGAWAGLFRKGAGYLGTELSHDETNPRRYLTIDRWESKEEYDAFISRWKDEYSTLDSQCEGLTESESCIGTFHKTPNA